MQQNPSYRESLGNWSPYFFNSIGALFYQIPMFWYTSSYVKCMGCPINLPLHGKMMQNSSSRESLGNGYPLFSLSLGSFFPLDSHAMVYFIICEIHGFPNPFPITWENTAKSIELGEPGKLVPMIFS